MYPQFTFGYWLFPLIHDSVLCFGPGLADGNGLIILFRRVVEMEVGALVDLGGSVYVAESGVWAEGHQATQVFDREGFASV